MKIRERIISLFSNVGIETTLSTCVLFYPNFNFKNYKSLAITQKSLLGKQHRWSYLGVVFLCMYVYSKSFFINLSDAINFDDIF